MGISKTIFDYATSELSSSAFWAWVLSSLCNAPGDDAPQDDVKVLAKLFLAGSGIQPEKVKLVRTEVSFKKGRADIVLYADKNETVILAIIENKLLSTPSIYDVYRQLESYRENCPEAKGFILTWRYDTAHDYNRDGKSWNVQFLDLDSQVEIMQKAHVRHPILQQYYSYAGKVQKSRHASLEELKRPIKEISFDGVKGSLAREDFQWALMNKLTDGCDIKEIYGGVNKGGGCWTQAKLPLPKGFCISYRKDWNEIFFYRLDRMNAKDVCQSPFYLRLNYYTWSEGKKLTQGEKNEKQAIIDDKVFPACKKAYRKNPFSLGELDLQPSYTKNKESSLWYIRFKDLRQDVTVNELNEWLRSWQRQFLVEMENW
ncbi:MAG: hypothetical protein GC185_11460 [Alphaproteobacteria bacterium]|nr:hypothetical protein [Alphaproteobacteria bacterium]